MDNFSTTVCAVYSMSQFITRCLRSWLLNLSSEFGLYSLQPPGRPGLLFLWRCPAGISESGRQTHARVFPLALSLSHRNEWGEEWGWEWRRGTVGSTPHVSVVYFLYICSLSVQESWSIRLSPQMRALWWQQHETLVLCFVPEHPGPSAPRRWDDPSPTLCWQFWTSTTYAKGCLW